MKKLVVFAVILMFSSSAVLFAQSNISGEKKENHFAVIFQVNQLLSFSGFDGSTFSGEYLFSKNSGLRLGITSRYSDTQTDVNYFNNDSLTESSSGDNNRKTILLTAIWIKNLLINDDINFFGGVGVLYGYSYSDATDDSSPKKHQSTTDNTYGIPFVAGAEWFIKDNISLSLEYDVAFWYEKEDRESTTYYDTYSTTKNSVNKSYKLEDSRVKMGIAFYF